MASLPEQEKEVGKERLLQPWSRGCGRGVGGGRWAAVARAPCQGGGGSGVSSHKRSGVRSLGVSKSTCPQVKAVLESKVNSFPEVQELLLEVAPREAGQEGTKEGHPALPAQASLSSPSRPITVDIQVNGAMADHQTQALGWGERGEGQGLLGDRGGAGGLSRGGAGSGRQGWQHAAQTHTDHRRQPVAPGPVPVQLGGPAGAGGLTQGHLDLRPQAAVGAAASPPVQGDAGNSENRRWRGSPGLQAAAPPGTHTELGLGQPVEPEGRGV